MKKLLIGFMCLGLVIGLFYSRAVAQNDNSKALILFIHGEVKMQRVKSGEWTDAETGVMLSEGDGILTGEDSWAELGLGRNFDNAVRIQEESKIRLGNLGPVKVNLIKGELRSLVEKLSKDETFEIVTPTSVCGVRGTGWDTETDGMKVVVDVYEDEVYFASILRQEAADPIIKSGKRAILEEPTKPIKIEDLPVNKMRGWNKWKQDFTKRRASKITKKLLKEKAGSAKGQQGKEDMIKGKEGLSEREDQKNIEDKRITEEGGGGHIY